MLKLTSHRKFHVPNGLALLAAVLLLTSSIIGSDTSSGVHSSGMDTGPSVKAENTEDMSDTVERKRRGLNLGFLLFRRG